MHPKMSKALSRAFEKTDLESFWNYQDLIDHLVNGEITVFQQIETGYFGVLQKCYSPRSSILNFFWSGKDPDNTLPTDWDEVDSFLVHAAKQLSCGIIQCDGRRGWKPILTSRGWSEDSVVYTKKVTYEYDVLPPVPSTGDEAEG